MIELPDNAIKDLTITLDTNREIPKIITVGSADKTFFTTINEITIRLDGKEKFS